MARQREVEAAILKQVEPMTLFFRYQNLASAGKKLIKSDIPATALGPLLDLAIRARSQGIEDLDLVPPVVNVAWPDFEEIREIISAKLATD